MKRLIKNKKISYVITKIQRNKNVTNVQAGKIKKTINNSNLDFIIKLDPLQATATAVVTR